MAVSSEFFAARVNDSVVRLDDSVEPQEFNQTPLCIFFQALLHYIYHGEMREDGPPAERVEALGRELGVRWFLEEGISRATKTFAGKRKRYRSRTPDPARNEDAEMAATYENELSKSTIEYLHLDKLNLVRIKKDF